MTHHPDEATQFWDQPEWTHTGQVPRGQHRGRSRSFERTRSHRIVRPDDPPPTRSLAFDDAPPEDADAWDGVDHWVEPQENESRGGGVGVDPKLLRIGAVGMAGVLLVPIALALREDDDDGGLRSQQVAGVAEVGSTVAPEVLGDPAATVVTIPNTVGATAPPVTTSAAIAPAPSASPATPPPAAQSAVQGVAAAPAEPVCAGTYTVISNDYWNRFPRSSGASVQDWLNANNATADTPLYVGDELCIPAGATAPAPPPPPTTTAPPATTAAPTTQAPATTQPPATTAAPVVTTAPATTPPVPATSPPVAAAPPAAAATDPATVEAIIREVWPDELEERALTIARRESGLRPHVRNYCCYGVFAIYFDMGRNFLPGLGITRAEQLFDARTNITAAYHLYTLAGWKPWVQTDPGG